MSSFRSVISKFLTIIVFMQIGCGAKPTQPADQITPLQGTWKFVSGTCQNQPVSPGDLTETITVSGNSMSIVDTSQSSQCVISSQVNLEQDGDNVFVTSGTGPTIGQLNCVASKANNFCQLTSCQIPNFITGTSPIPVTYTAPANFPIFLNGLVSYTFNQNTMTRTVTDPNGNSCLYKYSK